MRKELYRHNWLTYSLLFVMMSEIEMVWTDPLTNNTSTTQVPVFQKKDQQTTSQAVSTETTKDAVASSSSLENTKESNKTSTSAHQLTIFQSITSPAVSTKTSEQASPIENNKVSVSDVTSTTEATVSKDNKQTVVGASNLTESTSPPPMRLYYQCNPSDETPCVNLPGVKCLEQTGYSSIYACVCDYFHTYTNVIEPTTGQPSPSSERCLLNVFAPCDVGRVEEKCGDNMVCTLDTLRITNDKYCRCLPGYGPTENAFGIPAYCEKIVAVERDEDDEDYVDDNFNGCWRNVRNGNIFVIVLFATVVLFNK